MFERLRRARSRAGHTLVEAAISAGIVGGILLFSFPVFKSIGDAGEDGSTRLTAQAENHAGLMRLASELQNASTDAVDPGGNPRLLVTVGAAPAPKLDPRTNSAGGFRGRLGSWDWSTKHTQPTDGEDHYADEGNRSVEEATKSPGGTKAEPTEPPPEESGGLVNGVLKTATGLLGTHEEEAKGATSGNTRVGRERSDDMWGTAGYGASANRPRYSDIAANSVLTFQRVVGYGVDASGGPEVQWGAPIRYEVIDDALVRTQNGTSRVVAPFVTGFRAQISDTGTVLVTLVSQKQSRTTGEVVAHANQIEVVPKN